MLLLGILHHSVTQINTNQNLNCIYCQLYSYRELILVIGEKTNSLSGIHFQHKYNSTSAQSENLNQSTNQTLLCSTFHIGCQTKCLT